MELKCEHCKNEWDYKGKGEYYATCPNCLYKVKIKEVKKNGE
jgi:DNA-directed RNA polymerase subunit RPC12/RpoP